MSSRDRVYPIAAFDLALVLLAPPAARAAEETFVKDVAPILNRSCAGCHRPGEAAPMSLVGYENVRPWVRAIRQRVLARQMPPWTADPTASVAFENDPSLSQAEIDHIVRWIDAGAARGDGAEPAPPALALGWNDPSGREPDYVLALPVAYQVPASTTRASAGVLNPTFYVKVPFDDDRWIRAVQARPDQRSVVHYMDLNVVEFPEGTAPPGTVVQQMGAAATGAGQEIDFAAARSQPRRRLPVHGRVSERRRTSAADGASLRRAVAVRVSAVDAAGSAGRREDRGRRALQQLASNRTVTAPAQPGGDMFMPVMQYSVETNTSRQGGPLT